MRGFWYMLEAVLAGVLIIGFMIAITQFFSPVQGATDMSPAGYSQLRQLNDKSLLRGYASSGDYGSIEASISMPGYSHSVQVCDPSGYCAGSAPSGREVWISSYVVSGDDSYSPSIVKLYFWREE